MAQRFRPVLLVVAVLICAGLVSCTATGPDGDPTEHADTTQESNKDGTPGWAITQPGPEHAIEGFADRVSVLPGQPVRLFVSTTAQKFTVTAHRIGAYRSADAQQVWSSAPLPGTRQPGPRVVAPTNTVVAPWRPSLTVDTQGWPAGNYLFRLDGDNNAQQYVPLTVRSPSNAGRVVIVNAVTTWQAYNQWGGYSLYESPGGGRAERSRTVSFDRPYQQEAMQGAGDFLFFELPLLRVAERAGVPLGYATDVDLHADPHLLDGARAMVTLGHDEYWSSRMRAHTATARDHGVNLAFLGGNEIYRHIRFEPTALGPDRLQVNYKSFTDDPFSKTNPLEATPEWRSPPHSRPESVLLGNYYQCNPASADLVVANPGNWLLQGIVTPDTRLPGLVGNEYARIDLSVPTPRPIEVLFHSPVSCGGRDDFSDATYYTTPSGAGVFSSGTQSWICGLDPACRAGDGNGQTGRVVTAITTRLLRTFAQAPAGKTHPATDNLARLGIPGAQPNPAPTLPREPTLGG